MQKELNEAVGSQNALDGFFKAGYDAAFDAKDLEEFVPASLLLSALTFRTFPFAGEFDGDVADFVPRKRHGGVCAGKFAASIPGLEQCVWPVRRLRKSYFSEKGLHHFIFPGHWRRREDGI
jgi:hypothetical protein